MKLKQRLSHLVGVVLMFGILFFIAQTNRIVSSDIWRIIITGVYVLVGILAICWLFLCLKQFRKMGIVLVALLCGLSASARNLEDCDALEESSAAEANYCRYEVNKANSGPKLCKYIKTFNPTKIKKGDEEQYEMTDTVGAANELVRSYSVLTETYQGNEGVGCKFVTEDKRDASPKEKWNILKQNSDALCCAYAMQSLFQIYSSVNGERQIQTVPMALATEKTASCWPCDVVYLMITVLNTMTWRSAPAMATIGMFFLKWALAFWLLLRVGMLLLNRNEEGKPYAGSAFLQDVLTRILCVGLAAMLLYSTASQYDTQTLGNSSKTRMMPRETLLNPPLELIAGFGIELADSLLNGAESFYGKLRERVEISGDTVAKGYLKAMDSVNFCSETGTIQMSPAYMEITQANRQGGRGYTLDTESEGRLISNDLTKGILCLTQMAFKSTSPISAMGFILTTDAIVNGEKIFWGAVSFPKIMQLFYGLTLSLICMLLAAVVGFKVIDIMLRVGFVAILAPIFIATAAFPWTRAKYASVALKFAISALMSFIEVTIACAMAMPAFYHVLSGGASDELLDLMVAPSTSHYVNDLYAFVTKGGGIRYFLVCGVGFLSFQLFEIASQFFENVFDATGSNIGKGAMDSAFKELRENVGTVASSAVPGLKAGGQMGKAAAAKLGGKLADTKLGRWSGRRYQSAKSAGKKFYGAAKMVGNAADKAGKAVGTGMQKGGGNLIKSGAKMSTMGYGLGALIGVPMMAAGAVTWLGGTLNKGIAKGVTALARHAGSQAKTAVRGFFGRGSGETEEQRKKATEKIHDARKEDDEKKGFF